jgi:DnaJ family protein A protein 2
MMQQVQSTCDACNGVGEGFEDKDKCSECKGKGTMSTREVIEVHVPAGTANNKQFTFYEKGDEALGVSPGDLVVVVQQEPHPVFKRQGANLFLKKTLSLFQSLTGFEFQLVHLDGHKLSIKSHKGSVVPPGTVQVVRGQGMPLGHGSEMGDLYFEYDVVFPKTVNLSDAETHSLARALGTQEQKREVINTRTTLSQSADEDVRMEDEEVFLEDVDLSAERERWQEQQEQAKRTRGATEEDEDDGPRGVQQCRAQ